MSRSLKDANRAIFIQLDNHCSNRGTLLANAGTPRWIASERKHRNFMMNARIAECIHFSSNRKLVRCDNMNKSYLISIGFERNQRTFRDHELALDPAFLTVALSELQPRPVASLDEIR